MNKPASIGFLFKVDNVILQTLDEQLQITPAFVSRDVIDQINQSLKEKNFKVDERSIRPKYVDKQLFLEGFATEIQHAKEVGFLSGR